MAGLFSIRKEVPATVRWTLATLAWVVVIGVWAILTHWEFVNRFSVPTPLEVVKAFPALWKDSELLRNVALSWWRIGQAFFWCAVVAIPLGLLMASFRWVHDFVNPVAAPMRSMPITAFLPAFIGLFGIEERMKVIFLWFGMFFYLLAVVVEEVNRVDNALLDTAYTLGAKKRQVLWLMFRAAFPGIFSSFRILYDIGWTYVILAEIINRNGGVGAMIQSAEQFHRPDLVYAGIIAIGVAAFLFRALLTFLERILFPWQQATQAASQTPAAVGATHHRKATVTHGD